MSQVSITAPTVFLSVATIDLKEWRELLAKAFRAAQFRVLVQDESLGSSTGNVRELLEDAIQQSDCVIHLAGLGYGSPAQQPFLKAPDFQCSWTQFEYYYAHEISKKVIAFVCSASLSQFQKEEEGDKTERAHKTGLQQAHRDRVASGEFVGTPLAATHGRTSNDPTVNNVNELLTTVSAAVGKLQREHLAYGEAAKNITLELEGYLKAQVAQIRRVRHLVLICTLALFALITGGIAWLNRGQDKIQQVIVLTSKTQAEIIQTELAKLEPDDIKYQLNKAAEVSYQKDLQDADKLTDWQKRGSAKRSAAAARDQKLGMVDETVARFTRTIMSGNASPEYLELTRILQEQGIDQVVAYITSQVPRLLERADHRAAENQRENRRELAPLLECAKLQFINGKLAEAISLSEEVQKREPDWPENNQNYFWSMIRMVQMDLYGGDSKKAISRIEAIETRARRVQDSFPEDLPSRESLALAAGLRGDIYIQAGEFEQAEQRFKECHEALIPLSAEAPDNKSIQRSLAVLSDKLGRVLLNKNDDENAGLLFTQGRDLLTALLQKYPGDTDCLYSLAVSYESLGTLAMKKADYRLAGRCFEEQQTILIAFPEQNPLSVFARLSLVASHLNLGLVKAYLGEAQKARSMLSSAFRVLDALATESPDFQRVQETTFAAKYTTGRVLRITSDFQGSIDAYQSAHQYLREHPDLPRNGELLRHCKASSLMMESILLSTKGDILGARDKAVASLTVVEEIIQSRATGQPCRSHPTCNRLTAIGR